MTPRQAIRRFCIECMGGRSVLDRKAQERVLNCPALKCLLWDYRLGKSKGVVKLEVIRDYCLHCHGVEIGEDGKLEKSGEGLVWAGREAKGCTDLKCWLFPFRPGLIVYKNIAGDPSRFKSGGPRDGGDVGVNSPSRAAGSGMGAETPGKDQIEQV